MGKVLVKGFINKSGDQVELIPSEHTHVVGEITDMQETLSTKANAVHTHEIGDINQLQAKFNTKANVTHTHKIEQIERLSETLESTIAEIKEVSRKNPMCAITITAKDDPIEISNLFELAADLYKTSLSNELIVFLQNPLPDEEVSYPIKEKLIDKKYPVILLEDLNEYIVKPLTTTILHIYKGTDVLDLISREPIKPCFIVELIGEYQLEK